MFWLDGGVRSIWCISMLALGKCLRRQAVLLNIVCVMLGNPCLWFVVAAAGGRLQYCAGEGKLDLMECID
jgi:hypothetical protein